VLRVALVKSEERAGGVILLGHKTLIIQNTKQEFFFKFLGEFLYRQVANSIFTSYNCLNCTYFLVKIAVL